ncbi:MAG: 2-oxo acid dehydrogenase subunit E2, partial [Candidatus Omnitrophota bacterium]
MNELKLPEIGENITQGTVTKILVKVGESITKGQNIIELETDKAVVEIPSNMEGVISEVLIKTGTVVKIGQPIFQLGVSGVIANEVPQPIKEEIASSPSAPINETIPAATNISATNVETNMNLPILGENLEKGTITKILVKAGDSIKKGQNILELETDKAVLEVPSPSDALIKEILIQNGAVIKVGQPIFKILSSVTKQSSYSVIASKAKQSIKEEIASSPSALRNDTKYESVVHMPIRKDVAAAPSVRLFAREIGIDIGQVPGSGPGGRISIDDVKKFAKALNTGRVQVPATAGQKLLPDFSKWGSLRREPMSNVRRKTAEHLSSAWNSIPHVTQCDKADITELEKLRKASSTQTRKLSITSYLIKIIAIGLKKYPQFNASVDMNTNEVVLKDYINIGVAVDTDRGLLVPVLKNVDRLSVIQISDELSAMAERARNRKTGIEELQ